MQAPRLLSILFATLALHPSTASATYGTGIDAMENIFGATNINAIIGHGRLTAGVSQEGDLTVLAWPSPSYADQLGYLSSNAIDARSKPHLGAHDGMGSFLGLLVETDAGREVVWLRDGSVWTIEQDYGPSDGPNTHTTFSSASLGLVVTVVDAVHPTEDVLVRDVRVERAATSSVTGAHLLSYANLSPVPANSKVDKLPVGDWVLDGRNDFAAIWDEDSSAVIHFHPADQRVLRQTSDILGRPDVDFGSIGTALESASISLAELSALSAGLDSYSDGSYLAMTTLPAPDQFQVGFDQTPFCAGLDELADNMLALSDRFPAFSSPLPDAAVDALRCSQGQAQDFRSELGWAFIAEDALVDAADGELSGAGLAAGEVNEALRTPLTFASDGTSDVATAQLVLAAGSSAATVRATLASVNAATVASAAEAEVASWLEDKRLPTSLGAEVEAVARRTLISVRVGTDADSGAVVASIARQPPYYLDWPRDGAFFNVLLDVSGQTDLVTKRAGLYESWQRKEAVIREPFIDAEPPPTPDGREAQHYPASAWEMNYLPDGSPGGIFRFEIDTTAFAIWTIVAHVGWLPEASRADYLATRWEAIRTGTDLIAEWKDDATGLQAKAQEDDSGAHSQTIHGAATVLGAIEIASRAARMIGEDEDAKRWERRTIELRKAILEHLYDDEEERFVMGETARGPFAASGLTPSGPTGWAVWPMSVLALDDDRSQKQIDYDLGIVTPMIDLEEAGGLYFMKNTNAAAVALLGLEGDALVARRAELERLVRALASHATPGTRHFGEVMVVTENEDGTRLPEQRTATPHLWEGTLFYLTAMAVEDASTLLRYDEVLPPFPSASSGGCGCRSGGSGTGTGALVFSILLIYFARRSRKRPMFEHQDCEQVDS